MDPYGAFSGPMASTLEAVGLPFHIFHHNVVDLSQGGGVFQHLPGDVGVKMDLDQFLVPNGQKTVAWNMPGDIVVDSILRKVLSFDEKLGVELVIQHDHPPAFFISVCPFPIRSQRPPWSRGFRGAAAGAVSSWL